MGLATYQVAQAILRKAANAPITNSNPSPNQKRNLKPTVSAGAYSASPSQLTLSTDQITSSALGQHPYQQQNYTYSHDPSAAFAFPPHPQYRTHQQPQSLKQDHYAQHLQQQNQQQHHHLTSPTHSRKRRVSELGDPSLPSVSSSNNSVFANAPGHFSSNSADVDLGLGPPATLPSPAPKKGRTNTPWTPAEEQRLKTLRDAGSSWSEIAKTFPTRTEGSVKKHWYKVR